MGDKQTQSSSATHSLTRQVLNNQHPVNNVAGCSAAVLPLAATYCSSLAKAC